MVKCPVHGDRSASCSVNTEKQLFKCHSCGAAGSAWDLIMQMEGIDFDGARAFSAALGLPVGDAGGGDGELPAGRFGGRRKVPERKGNRPRGGAYKPSWRRG
ncbi:hypothetical protein E0H50_37790 [Kribbella sindirgiensis]|uniref:Zinc finger CHC2-type domain-containing protein n=1 Tax=Kribbella sindirgiensis TaxID=1124744 RepID=A0A4R0I2B3_9ACTN|nr:hypothetical protein E0H50_37790 [Kribbella sindirgiensis]